MQRFFVSRVAFGGCRTLARSVTTSVPHFEVEKKFQITKQQEDQLRQTAKLISEKQFTDRYFDNKGLSLSTKDMWLRSRQAVWELKVPLTVMNHNDANNVDHYKELSNESEIAEALGFKLTGRAFEQDLGSQGYTEFASITTHRTKYLKDDITVDVDLVTYNSPNSSSSSSHPSTDNTYRIAEAELVVTSNEERALAEARLISFLKSNGFSCQTIRGKVLEYIYRYRPLHYEALEASGLLGNKLGNHPS